MTLPFPVDPHLWPVEHRFVDVSGARIHYVDEGSGETLLLLHGNPAWSFLYRKMIAGLSPDFRCVAPDFPGYGMSGVPAGYGFTPREHSAVLEAFVEKLGLNSLTIMVQDWGGPIGLGLAARHPDKVRRLIIGNTFAWPLTNLLRIRVFSAVMGGPVGISLTRLFKLFSAAVTIAASLISGLLPAMKLLSSYPQASLQHSAGARAVTGSRSGQGLRHWLIGAQVFGCTALLLVTGLFSKSLLHLLHQDKGFDTSLSAIAEVRLTAKSFSDSASRVSFIDRTLQNLRTIPGVEAAGFLSAMPLEGDSWIEFAGRADRADQKGPLVNARWASPGHFEATGQKLIAGRFFEDRDRNLSSIVLSEGESKALWGGADPIGGQVNALGKAFTVIGVVGDSRNTSLKAEPARMIYVHYSFRTPSQIYFVARSRYGADSLVSSMREAIAKQAPNVTISRAKTMDAQLTDSLSRERFQTFVLVAFGASALLLAMLGIYGVLSYSVAARKQETGVRMALGATRSSVYRLAMAEAAGPVLAGLVAGLAASLATGRIVKKFLFGTQAVDPAVILMVIGLFGASAAAAAFLPARRAALINPMEALRPE